MRLLLVLVLVLALAAPAAAHVTVLPESSRPGETGEFVFRTPNEREDAATVKLEVFVPDGVPVEAEPVKGWTITRIAGGIQWAADAGVSIRPGRTEDFKARLGPLPDRPRLVFKALQYYADGQVVRWIQASGPDDERPAAILNLSGSGASAEENGAWPLYLGGAILLVAVLVVTTVVTRKRRRVI